MNEATKEILKMGATYAAYGLVTICDPHLVSDEAAEKSEVLNTVKLFTDGFFWGCKVVFCAPIWMAKGFIDQAKKRIEA